jgi:hypothetical protein
MRWAVVGVPGHVDGYNREICSSGSPTTVSLPHHVYEYAMGRGVLGRVDDYYGVNCALWLPTVDLFFHSPIIIHHPF